MKTRNGQEPGVSPIHTSKDTPNTDIPPLITHLPPKVAEVPKDVIKSFHHTKRVGNYLLGRTLGEGSFAKVKEGLHVLTGEKVAIKVVDKKRAKDDNYVRKNMRREGKLLQMVQHPNIVRLYEIMETENSYYLVTELCKGGDFMDYICQRKRVDEKDVKRYMRQIISAVDYLHRLGILHRDLKVENLLLDENKDIKIIDFGLSNNIKTSMATDGQLSQEFCATQCGSPAYAAPELLGHKQYGPKVDAWSIGVNMYAMLTGGLPFTVDPFNIKVLHNKMLTGQMNPLPGNVSKECKDFVRKLLIPFPEKRMSLSDAMKHPWLADGKGKPLEAFPCPNRIRPEDISDDILQHMGDFHGYRVSDVIRCITSNIPGPTTAMYHLYKCRFERYLAQQRVRGKIPAMDMRTRENNKLNILFKEPPGRHIPDRIETPKSMPIKDLGKHHISRPVKQLTKEDTLEPKVIQLEISRDVSVDIHANIEPRKTARSRPHPKLKKREARNEVDKASKSNNSKLDNEVVITDVTDGEKLNNVEQRVSPITQKGGQSLQDNAKKVLDKKQDEKQNIKHQDSHKSVFMGAKNPRTILSELLPKQMFLRHRMQRRFGRCNFMETKDPVDKNNNVDITVSDKTNNENYSKSNREVNNAKNDDTLKPISSNGEPGKTKVTGTLNFDPERPKVENRNSKDNTLNQSHINQFTEDFKPAKSLWKSDKDTKLIDVCYNPYARVSKSAGFRYMNNRLAKHIIDPKLMDKWAFEGKDIKTILRPKSPGATLPSTVKRESFDIESVEPFSPQSSRDSKSSRSTTNQSDRSTSTRSSNVALPSISISPTMMRTN